MFVNWWDNPTNPDSWHKHQVQCAGRATAAGAAPAGPWCQERARGGSQRQQRWPVRLLPLLV
jgi:hypothetical protein